MRDFLITLFLGWLGVHRFRKKKYITGLLWMCTLGLFGIGWIVDTIITFKNISNKNKSEQTTTISNRLIKSFNTLIVGTFAECHIDNSESREELIKWIKPKQKLELQYWEYKGKPAYHVLHPNGLDIGNIRKGLAEILYNEYSDCKFETTVVKKVIDKKNDCLTCEIKIDIYK